jgi:hypothetical protein
VILLNLDGFPQYFWLLITFLILCCGVIAFGAIIDSLIRSSEESFKLDLMLSSFVVFFNDFFF